MCLKYSGINTPVTPETAAAMQTTKASSHATCFLDAMATEVTSRVLMMVLCRFGKSYWYEYCAVVSVCGGFCC